MNPEEKRANVSARDAMLARVRNAQPDARDYPNVPLFQSAPDDTMLPSLKARFEQALDLMGGKIASIFEIGGPAEVPAWLAARFGEGVSIASATPEIPGNVPLAADTPPASLETLEVGVVRARFGVCETGSVWLSDKEYVVNAIGYIAQHLVVLLDPRNLEINLQHAYRRDDFMTAPYCVLVTGPSATADIEGVMIRGAQGVRSLTVVWWESGEAGNR